MHIMNPPFVCVIFFFLLLERLSERNKAIVEDAILKKRKKNSYGETWGENAGTEVAKAVKVMSRVSAGLLSSSEVKHVLNSEGVYGRRVEQWEEEGWMEEWEGVGGVGGVCQHTSVQKQTTKTKH